MRWRKFTTLLALIILATVVQLSWLAIPARAEEILESQESRDPWYIDVAGHWSEGYIRVLWEEGVTDGWLQATYGWLQAFYATFRPENYTSRSEFAVLVAKVFRLEPYEKETPSFADLPAGYLIYRVKRAYPYVEAAHRRGLVFGTGDGLFQPDAYLSREQAVAILVRGLGLLPYANGLPADEISLLLSRFADAARVDPSLRHELAAAIKLKLVQGYPDGTVRPKVMLRRSEAATLVYRSCLVVVEASPNPFSPDADGFEDSTVFTLSTLKNRNLTNWGLNVTSNDGRVLRSWGASAAFPTPPATIPWDGSSKNGPVLTPGSYFYQAWVMDRNAQTFASATMPLTLERRNLAGFLYPSVVAPGEHLTVRATTSGRAAGVNITWPWGEGPPLVPAKGAGNPVNEWSGTYQVPLDWEDGSLSVRLRANFDRITREITLDFRVVQPWRITGQVTPNPAMAGQRINLAAQANFSPDRVTAVLPGQSPLVMMPAGEGRWEYSYPLPLDTAEGNYDILITGNKGGKSKSTTVRLVVKGNILETLRFIITD